jgi:hypothetical protein
MPNKAYYLYAVARVDELASSGLNGCGVDDKSPLESVASGEVAGIVSEVDLSEYGPEALKSNFQDLNWLEAKMRCYDRVIRDLSEEMTIVPVRFGTLFFSRANVEAMLKTSSDKLLANLSALAGRWEMGLTFSFDRDKLSTSAQENSQEIRALRRKIEESGPGAAYLLRRKLESCAADLVDSSINAQIEKILSALRAVCAEVKVEAAGQDEAQKNICRWKISCLLDRDGGQDSRQVLVGALKQSFDNAVGVRITGPWPPYSFTAWDAGKCQSAQEVKDAVQL